MPSEDQDILAKISQLAGEFGAITYQIAKESELTVHSKGQINRHKNEQQHAPYSLHSQAGADLQRPYNCRMTHPELVNNTLNADKFEDHTQTNTGWRGIRGGFAGRGRGYPRGGRVPQVHRNRSLVLNGGVIPSISETASAKPSEDISTSSSPAPTSTAAWVTKTDRHLQLINPAIYEKQSLQRAKAIEETRKLKLKQRDEQERKKINNHLQRIVDSSESTSPSKYEIIVQGIRFRVVKNGSKLLRVSGKRLLSYSGISVSFLSHELDSRVIGDDNAAKSTPKSVTVGGVMFYRSKNGNLYRSGIVKAHRYGSTALRQRSVKGLARRNSTNILYARRRGMVKKINEPCRAFSTTGSFFSLN
jgi:hypothetical protein